MKANTEGTASQLTNVQVRKASGSLARGRLKWGFFFLAPWIIGFFGFQLLPILFTVFLSFTNYNLTKEFTFSNFSLVGFDNYARLFKDPDLLNSMGVTLKYTLIAVPLTLSVPLLFALLVNSRFLIFSNIFRTLFYLPTVIPVVAGVLVFQGVLNPQSGWIDMLLKVVGIDGPRWLSDPGWAIPALNLLSLWAVGNVMLIYLGALQGVPTELFEAATLDGAGPVQRFFRVTIPMISPVIFYNLTLGVINSFQYFVAALLIGGRNGDPQGATLFYNTHFYREAFVFNDMGYASTLALLLFVVVMIITSLMFKYLQRNVYYAGGEV